MKLIDKVYSLVKHDEQFMNLIFAYCDIPIINDNKLDIMI